MPATWPPLSLAATAAILLIALVSSMTSAADPAAPASQPAATATSPAEPGEFYVMGSVPRPGVYTLTGRQITVKHALSAAGADLAKLAGQSVVLVRRLPHDQASRTTIDIAAMLAGTAPDPVLAPNDILQVGPNPAPAPAAPLILTQTISLPNIKGGFNHHSADGKLRQVFLCCSGNKSVEVVDLAAGKIVKSLPGDRPVATCFAPDQKILCISRGKIVELYDTTTYQKPDTLAMPAYIDELRNDPAARQILAGSMDPPNTGIVPIDLVGKKLLDMLKLPSKPQGFALEDKGTRVFACTPVSDQVTVVDRKKPAAAEAWKLTTITGCFSLAFDPATHRLFVGCRSPAKLLVMNTDTGKAVASADIGTDTDDLAFDPVNKRVYVACGEGIISVIQQDDADHYRNIASIPSAPGARNSAFIPETGEFVVTVPAQGGQEAKALVYKAQPAQ